VAYYAAVTVVTILVRSDAISAADIDSNADAVADGHVLDLLTSGLAVDGSLVAWQIGLGALAAALVIRREGPVVWWLAALAGHVGSALITYALIGVATALGSASADASSDDPDYGISAVLAATLGALSASGVRAGDRLIVAVGIVAFVALLPFSIGWVDIEHPLAFGLGAAVVLGLGSHHARALRRQR
jgi:hypothetical protein